MKHILFTIFALATAVNANAQMDNVVEVENTYTPTVKDANKINVLPQTEATTVKHYDVEYQTGAKPTTDYAFEPAYAAQSDAIAKGEPKNFFTLAGGNGGNVLTRGSYGWELSDKNTLHFDLSLRGHNKEVELFNDKSSKWNQRYYQTKGNVRFERKLNTRSSFYVNGELSSTVYNYQHYRSGDEKFPFDFVSPTTSDKQHVWLPRITVGITPYNFGKFTVDGFARMEVMYLNEDYYFRESEIYTENIPGKTLADDPEQLPRYEGAVNLAYTIDSRHSVGLGLRDLFAHWTIRSSTGQNLFEARPHYAFHNEKVDLRLGAKLLIESGITKKFRVAPDASVAVHLTPDIDLFGEASGGVYFNDIFLFQQLTPYWKAPLEQLPSQFNQLEAVAGMKWRIREGWHAKFYGGYDISKNRAELTLPITDLYRNEILVADGSLVHLDAETQYSYKDIFTLEAKGRFNGWSIKKRNGYYDEDPAWRPVVEASAAATVQPLPGLRIGVDYQLATYTTDFNVDYDRPTTSNLGASISYKIPRHLLPVNLSVYCRGDNLLNQRYDAFYGYRAIGTTFLAGFAVNF